MADEPILSELAGHWQMSGTIGAKPAHYDAQGDWVLQHGFLRLHMQSSEPDGTAPPYEADVFLGYDRRADDYIAHWLDRFGAAGARVVGTGKRHGDQLVVVFPYAEAAFRNTYTLHHASHSWDLLIEAQHKDGSWTTFATYTATPAEN